MASDILPVKEATSPDRWLGTQVAAAQRSSHDVAREEHVVADPSGEFFQKVTNAVPATAAHGAVVRPIDPPATVTPETGADHATVAAATGLCLMGFSVRESSGTAAAQFALRNGTGTGDPLLVNVTLNANESDSRWFGPGGLAAAAGIFFDLIAGAVEVQVYSAVK